MHSMGKNVRTCFFLLILIIMAACSFLGFAAEPTWKTITIIDDGKRKPVKTENMYVDKILHDAKIPLGAHDKYWMSTDKLQDGTQIYIERAVPVKIEYGGTVKSIYTTQQTVQGAANEAGFDWRKNMTMEDSLTRISPNMTIHVEPYTVRQVEREESMPGPVVEWYDSSLAPGQHAVITPGTSGKKMITEKQYIVNGMVVRTEKVESQVVDPGSPQVERSGSWENTIGRIMHMEATAYHPSDGDGRGITATGTRAGYGTVAVDPSVIPLGTKVYIPSYGNATALDTGGAIVGNRIDLCMETFSECYSFGHRYVDVYVPN